MELCAKEQGLWNTQPPWSLLDPGRTCVPVLTTPALPAGIRKERFCLDRRENVVSQPEEPCVVRLGPLDLHGLQPWLLCLQ